MAILKTLAAEKAGVAATEFALAALPFCTILMGSVECGRAFLAQNTLQHASEFAARCAQIDTDSCGTDTGIKDLAARYARSVGATRDNFTVTRESCGIKVTGTMNFQSTSFIPLDMNLSAQFCRPN